MSHSQKTDEISKTKSNFLFRFLFRQKRRNSDDADARRGVRRSTRSNGSDFVVGGQNKFAGAKSRIREASQRKTKPGKHTFLLFF